MTGAVSADRDDAAKRHAPEHGDSGGTPGKATRVGGHDALGRKENLVSPEFDDMAAIVREVAPQFAPLGMKFSSEIMLATVLQEAGNVNPVTDIAPDNGLGLMQITAYHGKLDANVAKALHWNNDASLSYNIAHSKWRDAKANLRAGALTMLDKARYIKAGAPKVWAEMTDGQRWRATMYAYNAGQQAAISALERGGPSAHMISTFTINGKTQSHDYTKELEAKQDYVDKHDPFKAGGAAPATDSKPAAKPSKPAPKPVEKPKATETAKQKADGFRPAPTLEEVASGAKFIEVHMAGESVEFIQLHIEASPDGEFGSVTQGRLRSYQSERGLEPDGVVGVHTLHAIKSNAPKKPAPPKKPANGGGGGKKGASGEPHKPPPSGGDPVAIARHFVGMESYDHRLQEGIKGAGWHYYPVGGRTNNCAEFVTSVQRMAGRMSYQQASVSSLMKQLPATGWKETTRAKSRPGDIWACDFGGISHTVIVSESGQSSSIGADGGSDEVIKDEAMGYAGAKYYTKD